MGYEKVALGSIYFDKGPIGPECGMNYPLKAYARNGPIFGDTVPGKAITWIKPDGTDLLICDRVILRMASWVDLNWHGFVSGKVVRIDGEYYRCRLLQVGNRKGAPNEWDKALDIVGEDDDILHWKSDSFWGSDMPITDGRNTKVRVHRGHKSARAWGDDPYTTVRPGIGFRPVLEPIRELSLEGTFVRLDGHIFFLTQFRSIAGQKSSFPYDRLFLHLFPVDNILCQGMSLACVPMYTLLSDNQPVIQSRAESEQYHRKGQKLTLTDKFYDEEFLISWDISHGMAMTSWPVLSCDDETQFI